MVPAQVKLSVEKLSGRAMYPAAITALFTGMRRSELLALQWRNIDLSGGQLEVQRAIEENASWIET